LEASVWKIQLDPGRYEYSLSAAFVVGVLGPQWFEGTAEIDLAQMIDHTDPRLSGLIPTLGVLSGFGLPVLEFLAKYRFLSQLPQVLFRTGSKQDNSVD